jgi:hypothetical protein
VMEPLFVAAKIRRNIVYHSIKSLIYNDNSVIKVRQC